MHKISGGSGFGNRDYLDVEHDDDDDDDDDDYEYSENESEEESSDEDENWFHVKNLEWSSNSYPMK